MTKVGLITYHASHNIGSMLQTYALQKTLEDKFSCSVEIINFSSKEQQEMYSIFQKRKNLKNIVKNAISLFYYRPFKKRYDEFENFIENYFHISSKKFSDEKNLLDFDNKYDYVICGSDQIWNVSCTDFSDAYFLPFIKKTKKIAYAPSLGGRNILTSGKDLNKYKKYIDSFDHLSVREVNGKKWLDELSDQKFQIVADPTLLADEKIWQELLPNKKASSDYIFYYGVPFSKKTYSILAKISKKLNMPVIMLDLKSYIFGGNIFRNIKISDSGSPQEYLHLMKNAKLVITTSFHGTIFATIFKKNFWTITFKETNPDDDRISSLLTQLNMSNRRIYIEDYHKYDLFEPVNYENYYNDLRVLKDNSTNYLKNAFNQL